MQLYTTTVHYSAIPLQYYTELLWAERLTVLFRLLQYKSTNLVFVKCDQTTQCLLYHSRQEGDTTLKKYLKNQVGGGKGVKSNSCF